MCPSIRPAPLLLAALVAASCSRPAPVPVPVPVPVPAPPVPLSLARRFPTAAKPGVRFDGCLLASPLVYQDAGVPLVIVADGGGTVAALDPGTGASVWSVALPAPAGERAFVVATPAIVGDRLVVAYHTRAEALGASGVDVNAVRLRQRVAVVDLAARALDPGFSFVELQAALPAFGGGTVTFDPTHALARGTVQWAQPPGGTLGRVYVTFGNVRDIQPWHGSIFELDLDAWQKGGAAAAVTAARATTPESDCGPDGADGLREQSCGGGLWAPAGPLVVPAAGGYELIVAPGNGQQDLGRGDLSNTLVRLGPGLTLQTGCDPFACAGFTSDAPNEACLTSCSDVFVARLMPNEPPVRPESGACDALGTYACWSSLDYLDGSVPARAVLPSGRAVLVYTTKDGHAWLVDADHLGTLYDRAGLVAYCGTKADPCTMDWAGMIVTQPALTQVAGDVTAVVPTFMPDSTHPAGVFALRVVDAASGPVIATLWAFPSQSSPEAVSRFRLPPSRAALATPVPAAGEHAFVVETAASGGQGALLALRMSDGTLSAEATLAGPGYRFIEPLVVGSTVFVTSCDSDGGQGWVEGYDVE